MGLGLAHLTSPSRPSRPPFFLEEGARAAPHPLYKESPQGERRQTIPLQEKGELPVGASPLQCASPPPFSFVRAPIVWCLDRLRSIFVAACRRAAGTLNPADLLPQLRWIGEEEEVVFHRMCAKPLRYCTCGTCCRTVFVNIKFVAVRDRRDLEVAT